MCLLYAQVMQLAGLEGQQVVLLLEDYQFVHPAFLEMVNSLLSSGVYCNCVLFYNENRFETDEIKCSQQTYIILENITAILGFSSNPSLSDYPLVLS